MLIKYTAQKKDNKQTWERSTPRIAFVRSQVRTPHYSLILEERVIVMKIKVKTTLMKILKLEERIMKARTMKKIFQSYLRTQLFWRMKNNIGTG